MTNGNRIELFPRYRALLLDRPYIKGVFLGIPIGLTATTIIYSVILQDGDMVTIAFAAFATLIYFTFIKDQVKQNV